MPLEAILLDQGENAVHLPLIVNVLGEDVFVEWIAGRAVHEEIDRSPMRTRAFRQELPALRRIVVAASLGLPAETASRRWPVRPGIEPFRIKHGALIVIAEQDHLAFHDQIDAFARIGSVADDIAQAINFGDFCFWMSSSTA